MKTVYLIQHTTAYGNDRTPVMAFENEEEARDYAETLRPCVSGSLEVVPLKLEPVRDVPKFPSVDPLGKIYGVSSCQQAVSPWRGTPGEPEVLL